MLARFMKVAFLAPTLSMTYPITCDPQTSPIPKKLMAIKPFEVRSADFKVSSPAVSFSYIIIAGINKLDQKETEKPVHNIYASK